MRLLKDIKNVKSNWRAIQNSPYASLHFKYRTTLMTLVLFSAYITYTIVKIVLNYFGSGVQSWIMRFFTLGIGILIIFKAFQTLGPIKRAMKPYEKNKKLINHTTESAKVEIDAILSQFDDDGIRKNNNHLGKREINLNKQKK